MPVPKSLKAVGPRLLLRDVVYEKLVDAICHGVLEPGERLLDDDLTGRLGVSRTPIREALMRLAHEGLIEMEANRHTRVVQRSAHEYTASSTFLAGLHTIALTEAASAGRASRASIAAIAADLEHGIQAHDVQALHDLRLAFSTLVQAIGNRLLTETERTARVQATFHVQADGAVIDWSRAARSVTDLADIGH